MNLSYKSSKHIVVNKLIYHRFIKHHPCVNEQTQNIFVDHYFSLLNAIREYGARTSKKEPCQMNSLLLCCFDISNADRRSLVAVVIIIYYSVP